MLTPEQRVRHARHRSIVELGDPGVLALLAAELGPALSDPRAEAVRRDYLQRAGLHGDAAPTVPVDVSAFAGAPYLAEAAAACLGALHAVARIKAVASIARADVVPPFRLREDT